MGVLQQEYKDWNERKKDERSLVVTIFYGLLSLVRALGIALLYTAWIIVGVTLAANYFPSFVLYKDFIWKIWWLFFFADFIYEGIISFKKL